MEMREGLSYVALIVVLVVSSICRMKHFFTARRSSQKGTSSCDDASPPTLNGEVLDADNSSVDTCAYKSFDDRESSDDNDYEVFLSFRGPDTRSGITDFLFTSFVEAGIRVYRDDEELRVGEEIGPELLQAIKQSKISIPIFSKGYASSKWCLMELVKMVECKNETRQKIMPIFYDVEPSKVRHQTHDYEKAFVTHAQKKRYDDRTIDERKAALKEVGALKGWDLTSKPNRREGNFAKEVTISVLTELKKTYLEVSSCFVEIDTEVDEIMRLIGTHSNKTKIIGIHGMGGIGKTTLAKIVYNRLSSDFQNCCFLANIRETSEQKGIEHLQNQLISNVLRMKWQDIDHVNEGKKMIKQRLSSKKVLLLLDDVDQKIQLDALMGDRNWYGKGSKIIVTTRNKEILNVPKVDGSYEFMGMDLDNSLRLFSRHAFRSDHPLKEYVAESIKVVNISGGLPLALEVIGSFLCGKDKIFWDAKLKKLEKVPHKDVKKKLMISYEALDNQQKNIFLDIACFFIGFDRRIVIYMWDSCNLFSEEAIEVLLQMSLIKIKDNKLWMHDQLRDLGRDIVYQDSEAKPEKQSRVWDPEQAFGVFTRIKGTKEIEAMCLKFDHRSQYSFTKKEFASLPNLRFLQVDCINFDETIEHFRAQVRLLRYNWRSNVIPTKFIMKKPLIVSKLRWLSWHNFPKVFKLTGFSLTELVILDLSRSKITENWDGWSHIKMAKNLKVLNLTRCTKLERTPNFSNYVKLEQLILEGCESLTQIDKSISQLTHLILLNINCCRQLCELPHELGKLEALTKLLIEGTSITKIPEWMGMKKLEILKAGNCSQLKQPSSIGFFTSLTRLSLVQTSFVQLPNSIGQLVSLTELDLSHSKITELPHSMEKMKNLKVLKLCNSSLKTLPSFIGMLSKLEEIHGDWCYQLRGEVSSGIVNLPFLRILKLTTTEIEYVPKLPDSLNVLWFSTSSMTTLEDCSTLSNLTELALGFLRVNRPNEQLEDPSPWWIGSLRNLESLIFTSDYFTTIPTDIILLSKLRELRLTGPLLCSLPQLPLSLSCLFLYGCNGLTSIDLLNLAALAKLKVTNCENIKEIQGLECLENLRMLYLERATSLEKLPDLTNLKQLKELVLNNCWNVTELKCTSESLEIIGLEFCSSLEKLPHASNFKELKHLSALGSGRLRRYLFSSDGWRKWIENRCHTFSG